LTSRHQEHRAAGPLRSRIRRHRTFSIFTVSPKLYCHSFVVRKISSPLFSASTFAKVCAQPLPATPPYHRITARAQPSRIEPYACLPSRIPAPIITRRAHTDAPVPFPRPAAAYSTFPSHRQHTAGLVYLSYIYSTILTPVYPRPRCPPQPPRSRLRPS
jgi:hypothetical protein